MPVHTAAACVASQLSCFTPCVSTSTGRLRESSALCWAGQRPLHCCCCKDASAGPIPSPGAPECRQLVERCPEGLLQLLRVSHLSSVVSCGGS
jgi:hypothetical protein